MHVPFANLLKNRFWEQILKDLDFICQNLISEYSFDQCSESYTHFNVFYLNFKCKKNVFSFRPFTWTPELPFFFLSREFFFKYFLLNCTGIAGQKKVSWKLPFFFLRRFPKSQFGDFHFFRPRMIAKHCFHFFGPPTYISFWSCSDRSDCKSICFWSFPFSSRSLHVKKEEKKVQNLIQKRKSLCEKPSKRFSAAVGLWMPRIGDDHKSTKNIDTQTNRIARRSCDETRLPLNSVRRDSSLECSAFNSRLKTTKKSKRKFEDFVFIFGFRMQSADCVLSAHSLVISPLSLVCKLVYLSQTDVSLSFPLRCPWQLIPIRPTSKS